MDYFVGITGAVNVRKRYLELAKQHHPDKGGDIKVMQEINRQYDNLKARGYNSGGYTYTSGFSNRWSSTRYTDPTGRASHASATMEDIWRAMQEAERRQRERKQDAEWEEFAKKERQRRAEEKARQAKDPAQEQSERFERWVHQQAREYLDRFFLMSKEEVLEETGKLYRNWLRITAREKFAREDKPKDKRGGNDESRVHGFNWDEF